MPEPFSTAGTSAARCVYGLRLGFTTKRHNRIVEREYEDRVRWARDDHAAEEKRLRELDEELNKMNLFYSGHAIKVRAEVRELHARRWRDRKSEGDRTIEDAHDEENLLHYIDRKLARRPWPENPHADEIDYLTREWDQFFETHPMMQSSLRAPAPLPPSDS
jgi:hypothetical protein